MVSIANSARELIEVLQKEVGLKINASKTKVLQTSGIPKAILRVDSISLKEVDSFIYLDQEMITRDNVQPENCTSKGYWAAHIL